MSLVAGTELAALAVDAHRRCRVIDCLRLTRTAQDVVVEAEVGAVGRSRSRSIASRATVGDLDVGLSW